MSFKKLSATNSFVSFNSDASCKFKELYEDAVIEDCTLSQKHQPSASFAPSSFRCDRLSYFRLKGIKPDSNPSIDPQMNFAAMIGTACHKDIQRILKTKLVNVWVDVEDYLQKNNLNFAYQIILKSEYECQLQGLQIPIKFSVDGILNFNSHYYLLEIKTSDHNSFKLLDKPKSHHIDQIKLYCSLLNLHSVLMLYQDRSYGAIKCFEVTVTESEFQEVNNKINNVLDCVKHNILPKKLPDNDKFCTYCSYSQKCKKW